MSRPGDCLTAGPSIESARRDIRLRSQMARSGQDMFLAACVWPGLPGCQAAWTPGSPDYLLYQYQADIISPARRKRGERSSGGSRIHSGPRHYHEDGNQTDDARRPSLSKRLRFQTLHAIMQRGRSSP